MCAKKRLKEIKKRLDDLSGRFIFRLMKRLLFFITLFVFCSSIFASIYDATLAQYPKLDSDTSDSERIQRAIDALPHKVLCIGYGEYKLDKKIIIKNGASLLLHKSAKFVATAKMDYMFDLIAEPQKNYVFDHNMFVKGGEFDANGIADNCMRLAGFKHFTISDSLFRNPKHAGLRIDAGYEIIASNLYFRCTKRGLEGNSALYINGGDSHYNDIVVVDYTVGFKIMRGGSCRLTRCHVWGGPIQSEKKGDIRPMLKNSIAFDIQTKGETLLRDCYADTAMIGFNVNGNCRLLGCSYFNNYKVFKMDNPTIINHTGGGLVVADCSFLRTSPKSTLYTAKNDAKLLAWRDNMVRGFYLSDVPTPTPEGLIRQWKR